MANSHRYVLSISVREVEGAMSFSSPTPFQAISRGDLFDTTGWDDMGKLRGKRLRVVHVEHVVFAVAEDKPAFHQVRLYTTLADKHELDPDDVIEDWQG